MIIQDESLTPGLTQTERIAVMAALGREVRLEFPYFTSVLFFKRTIPLHHWLWRTPVVLLLSGSRFSSAQYLKQRVSYKDVESKPEIIAKTGPGGYPDAVKRSDLLG